MKRFLTVFVLSIFVGLTFTEIDPGISKPNAQRVHSTTGYYVMVRAVTSGEADHKPFILTEEAIRTGAASFMDRPVLLNHDSRVESIVGRVIATRARWDPEIQKWVIEAVFHVVDGKTIAKIKDGRIRFVSVGFDFRPEHTTIVLARQLRWRKINRIVGMEISFVAVPAVRAAKILQHSRSKISFNK